MDTFGADARFEAIAEFSDLTAAESYKSLLEENGIQAFVPGAGTHSLQVPGLSQAFGLSRQILLCVPNHEAERARRMLDEFAQRDFSDAADEDTQADDVDSEEDQDDAAWDAEEEDLDATEEDWDVAEEDYEHDVLTEEDDHLDDIAPDVDPFRQPFQEIGSDDDPFCAPLDDIVPDDSPSRAPFDDTALDDDPSRHPLDDVASDAGATDGLALAFKWLLIAAVGVVLFRLSLYLF